MTLSQGIDRIAEEATPDADGDTNHPHLAELLKAGMTNEFYAGCAEVARRWFEIEEEEEWSTDTDPDWQNDYKRDNKYDTL